MQSIDIFWTGGMDSTYRVLELILIEEKKVCPHYIIDLSRASTLYEIKAIEKIKSILNIRQPHTNEVLLPLNIVYKTDIKENEKITGWYKNIKKQLRIGIQYEWLARFAYQFKMNEIELCLERDPKGEESDFDKLLLGSFKGKGHECRLNVNGHADPNLLLFKNFRLPIFHLTKLDLYHQAHQYGFADLLQLTWFCHKPTSKGSICGICYPCQIFMRSGLKKFYKFDSDIMANRLKNKIKKTARAICRSRIF